jgi:colicin import membrane protein
MKLLLASALFLAAILPVHAQETDVEAKEAKERDRIKAEKAVVEERFKVEEHACRQKFAVNDCVDRARRSRRDDMAGLQRQEQVLNDAERKRRSAERRKELDERVSPERQQEAADKRAKALQDTKDREDRNSEKAAKRAADQAGKAAHPSAPKAARPGTVEPQGKARPSRAFNVPQPEASKAAANRAKYESNQKDAAQHKAAVREREAKRTKPPASALPAPAN